MQNTQQDHIQIFNFESSNIRIQIIDGKEYFCAKDVCDILEIKNSRDALSRVDEGDVVSTDIGVVTGTKGDGTDAIQNVKMSFVNEAGLYALVFQSKKPESKKFKQWIFNEVLPSIRKTGSYQVNQPKELTNEYIGELLMAAYNTITENDAKIKKEREARIQAEFQAKQLGQLIRIDRDLSFTMVAKILHLHPNKFIQDLIAKGYIEKKSPHLPMTYYASQGYFKVVSGDKRDGSEVIKSYQQTLVTIKGFDWIRDKVNSEFAHLLLKSDITKEIAC